MDEKERLRAQIKAYEYYAGLIERAVGGGALPIMPRWDEQRALEYRDLVVQLKRRLAELEAAEAGDGSKPRAAGAEAAAEPETVVGVSSSEAGSGTRS